MTTNTKVQHLTFAEIKQLPPYPATTPVYGWIEAGWDQLSKEGFGEFFYDPETGAMNVFFADDNGSPTPEFNIYNLAEAQVEDDDQEFMMNVDGMVWTLTVALPEHSGHTE